MNSIFIKEHAVNSPFGLGIEPLWKALIEKRSALKPATRFDTANFAASNSAEIELVADAADSLVWALMEPLRDEIADWNSDHLVLATTKGEIDLLEREIRGNSLNPTNSRGGESPLGRFLKKALRFFNIPDGTLVSAACASSNIALHRAAEMLLAGKCSRPVVLGIDIVSKFVFSGFSALQALSPTDSVRPFDKNRNGLLPGEACAAALLEVSSSPPPRGSAEIAGWGVSTDANHVTGPSRDGSGLAKAVRSAIDSAGIAPEDIACVCAHGTATVYNDAMEMRAFSTLFQRPVPVFSVKGAFGHTMGAAGILETIISAKALGEGMAPPTVGLSTPDDLADGWVSPNSANIADGAILNVNSGFGGINAALILTPESVIKFRKKFI